MFEASGVTRTITTVGATTTEQVVDPGSGETRTFVNGTLQSVVTDTGLRYAGSGLTLQPVRDNNWSQDVHIQPLGVVAAGRSVVQVGRNVLHGGQTPLVANQTGAAGGGFPDSWVLPQVTVLQYTAEDPYAAWYQAAYAAGNNVVFGLFQYIGGTGATPPRFDFIPEVAARSAALLPGYGEFVSATLTQPDGTVRMVANAASSFPGSSAMSLFQHHSIMVLPPGPSPRVGGPTGGGWTGTTPPPTPPAPPKPHYVVVYTESGFLPSQQSDMKLGIDTKQAPGVYWQSISGPGDLYNVREVKNQHGDVDHYEYQLKNHGKEIYISETRPVAVTTKTLSTAALIPGAGLIPNLPSSIEVPDMPAIPKQDYNGELITIHGGGQGTPATMTPLANTLQHMFPVTRDDIDWNQVLDTNNNWQVFMASLPLVHDQISGASVQSPFLQIAPNNAAADLVAQTFDSLSNQTKRRVVVTDCYGSDLFFEALLNPNSPPGSVINSNTTLVLVASSMKYLTKPAVWPQLLQAKRVILINGKGESLGDHFQSQFPFGDRSFESLSDFLGSASQYGANWQQNLPSNVEVKEAHPNSNFKTIWAIDKEHQDRLSAINATSSWLSPELIGGQMIGEEARYRAEIAKLAFNTVKSTMWDWHASLTYDPNNLRYISDRVDWLEGEA